MQIDFHHGAVYAIARIAGFKHEDAAIVAYSSQYVDDATREGLIKFENNAKYSRIASAHGMFDYKNFNELDTQKVWVPFHFLPGNDGLLAEENPVEFIHKLVCQPNSYVSNDMLDACINDSNKPYGLYRLGITIHVYGDTWSHYGFAGVSHKINKVTNLILLNHPTGIMDKIENYWGDLWSKTKSSFVADVNPLGHGPALTCPDLPYLHWKYTNGLGQEIIRNNPQDFYAACFTMFQHMVDYRKRLGEDTPDGISDADAKQFEKNINEFVSTDADERHDMWLNSISKGNFSFGQVPIEDLKYIAKEKGSWKNKALGTIEDSAHTNEGIKNNEDEIFEFTPEFMKSNWKLFHDALQAHHFSIARDILPKYGICIA